MLVAQSGLTLCDPMNCTPPGSSIHGIFQARILEWTAIISRRSFWPRNRTQVSRTAGRLFTIWATKEEQDTQCKKSSKKTCPPLCDPMDRIVHGILQAGILGWVVSPVSSRSSQPRNQVGLLHCRQNHYQLSSEGSQTKGKVSLKTFIVLSLLTFL